MKKTILVALAALFASSNLQAQKKSGAIQFETVTDFAAVATASGMKLSEEMLARMPKNATTNFELLFNPTHASYMKVEELEDSNTSNSGGMARMMMRFGAGSNSDYFFNLETKTLTDVFELNDTTYAMEKKLKLFISAPITMAKEGAVKYAAEPPLVEAIKTEETKKILGFDCHKVIVKSTRKAMVLDMEKEITDETILWYTNDLGFDFSPNPNMWTEGAVLEISGRGNFTQAKSIEYRKISKSDVTAPKDVTAITEEAYKAKMDARMKKIKARVER
ncbi:MAG: hypothetical protein K2Q03_04535 [Sphingobacteriaceae bacterium]|nr:hypothetical protein [Sphingobacteriaceae bacterium]